jgi:pyrophosphatase PpaX
MPAAPPPPAGVRTTPSALRRLATRPPAAWLLDLDGTLLDTIPLIVETWRRATADVLGTPAAPERLHANLALPLYEHAAALAPGRTGELADAYWRHYAPRAASARAFAGVEGALRALARTGAALAVVTSKRRRTLATALASLPSDVAFAAVVAAEDTERHKPHPDPLLLALERLGADAGDAAYVGDSTLDVRAARAAGVLAVGVAWGADGPDALAAAGADVVVESPAALAGIAAGAALPA